MNKVLQTHNSDRRPSRRGGSALIIALWTIALLSMLVMSFALDAMLEGRISTYMRQRRRVDYLTQSGVAIAEMLLEKQQNVSSSSSSDDEEDRWKEPALRIKRGQTAVVDEPIGDGVVHVEIIPEPARWNINVLVGKDYDEVWDSIFKASGLPEEYYAELIDCWTDWVDEDSTTRSADGAEDDYYKSLEPPYRARNKLIDTVDELRLVKGFVPAILDGGVLNPEERKELQVSVKGIKELFTTYGDGKINVNAAPMEVLMTIPGIDELAAGAIIEEREGRNAGVSSLGRTPSSAGSSRSGTGSTRTGALSGSGTSAGSKRSGSGSARTGTVAGAAATTGSDEDDFSFKSVADFMSRVPGLDTGVSRFVSTVSGTFRLVIGGEAAGVKHAIQAIAEVEGSKVRYLRWREDP